MEVFQVDTPKDRSDSMDPIPVRPDAHYDESKL